jgi:hypothetical protein
LAASAPDLATNVNKKLIQNNTTNSNRTDLIANGHHLKMITNEPQKTKHDDIWEEEDEDDDDSDHHTPSPPVKNKQTLNNNHVNTQQVRLTIQITFVNIYFLDKKINIDCNYKIRRSFNDNKYCDFRTFTTIISSITINCNSKKNSRDF